jgi:hypothetical protein
MADDSVARNAVLLDLHSQAEERFVDSRAVVCALHGQLADCGSVAEIDDQLRLAFRRLAPALQLQVRPHAATAHWQQSIHASQRLRGSVPP